jgi:hypothetical protein
MYLQTCQPNSDAPQNFRIGQQCIIETRCVDKDYPMVGEIVETFTKDGLNIGCTQHQPLAGHRHCLPGCVIDELSVKISLGNLAELWSYGAFPSPSSPNYAEWCILMSCILSCIMNY